MRGLIRAPASRQERARADGPEPGRGIHAAGLAAGAFLFIYMSLAACAAAPSQTAGRIRVAVSVPPQAYLVERIGGPHVTVEVMIPPGASHTTYSPSPRQMVALSGARLYVLVGHPAFLFESEHIAPFLVENPAIRVVDMSAGMDLILEGGHGEGGAEPSRSAEGGAEPSGSTEGGPEPSSDHEERPGLFGGGEEDHDHSGGDPHVWVAPSSMRVAAGNVARALSELDPPHAALYRANLAALLADVGALDREVRALLAGTPYRSFMVYHPAWGYFAREYGLTQIAIESGGREPSAARLIELVDLARRERVKAIFVQRGFAWKSARVLADEIGGSVVVVDPMGQDWLGEMRAAARAFREALDRG